MARLLNEAKLATLLIDLLTLDEEAIDARTAHLRFDIDLLAERLVESGALDEVARLAREWFHRHLIPGYSNAPDATRGAPSA